MERRLIIHEQLKSSKLTKLTLKQNNQNVTLNLKEDLLNESILLNDKVLCMLESIAKKEYEKKTQNSDVQLLIKPTIEENQVVKQPLDESIPIIDNEKIIKNLADDVTKAIEEKVDVDLIQKVEELPKKLPKPIKPSNNETRKVVSEEIHLCRICCLNSVSEKALHDHITRIHGGSEFRKRHANLIDEDIESESECEQQATAYPTPNVAIRVAKVAYYDSKHNNSNAKDNFLKSNLLTNGVRGNFFSQERLPLRSCKIKLELADNKNENIVPKEKISNFFKNLLSYVPFSVKTIDDLVAQNDLIDEKLSYLREMHKTIRDARELGITLYDLKKKVSLTSMNLLKELLETLTRDYLVLVVGVVERVYVAHEFCQPWLISSLKSLKGRSNFQTQTDDLDLSPQKITSTEDDSLRLTRSRRSAINFKRPLNDEEDNKLKNYKKVQLVPRPWRYIDGLLNRKALQKMLESLLLYIKTNPSSTFETISLHYSPALQPIMTLELLEMLEYFNCVSRMRLKREQECTLTSEFHGESSFVTNEDELNGDEEQILDVNENCLFIIKQVFNS